VKRELGCPAYLRYVDDFALFSNSKRQLWRWKHAVIERLAKIRLKIHNRAQVVPVKSGIPWLGFIVYQPTAGSRHTTSTISAAGFKTDGNHIARVRYPLASLMRPCRDGSIMPAMPIPGGFVASYFGDL
jgi:hypothetical protein